MTTLSLSTLRVVLASRRELFDLLTPLISSFGNLQLSPYSSIMQVVHSPQLRYLNLD